MIEEQLPDLVVVSLASSVVLLDFRRGNGKVCWELGDAFYRVLAESVQHVSDVKVLKVGVNGGA